MFKFYEDFKTHSDDGQPFCFQIERSSNLTHMHGGVKPNGYAISCSGNKYLFKTPELKNFTIKLKFQYTQMSFKNTGWSEFALKTPEWMCYFQYDKKTRCGKAIAFETQFCGKLAVKMMSIDGIKKIVEKKFELKGLEFQEGKEYEVKINVKSSQIKVSFDGREFLFNAESKGGYIGLGRSNFTGEVIFRSAELTSNDFIKKETVLPKQTAVIPTLNGGAIPYILHFETYKLNEIYNFRFELTGGVYSREIVKNANPGQYSVEYDLFKNPYIKIQSGKKEFKINIKNGNLMIHDPNLHWEFLREYFDSETMPLCKETEVEQCFAKENIRVVFGYENLEVKGFKMQTGGPSEFIFDSKGTLLYQGAALCGNTYEFLSPPNKKIIDLIPKDLYEYDTVIEHLKNNHYFLEQEGIKITLRLRSKSDEMPVIKAGIHDIFDEPLYENLTLEMSETEKNFLNTGYWERQYSVLHKPLKSGVYRMVFLVYRGEKVLKKASVTFEVLSPYDNIAPPLKSDLPFLYSTPNEDRFLERDSFDLWNPMPSCDSEHYFSCSSFLPDVGIRKRVWEGNKLFGREWFMWLDSRTARDWDYTLFIEGVKHVDYMNYQLSDILRFDLWKIDTYTPYVLSILHNFLNEHPKIACDLAYNTQSDKFTLENLNELETKYHEEWYDYACREFRELMLKQNREFLKLNPNYKRAYYGPFSLYTCPYGTYNLLHYFGLGPSYDLSEQYSGFMQFEDYPYSCSYFSYRGAFAAMTLKLYQPDLKIYPELYNSSYGGCPDGLVAFANPPLGKFKMPAYFLLTQSYEYVFCTAYRTNGGYNYWRDYGFMLRDKTPELLETFMLGWKYAVKHKPKKSLKTTAFVTEFDSADNRYNGDFIDSYGWGFIHNISEEGEGFLYGCARESGLSAGYSLKLDTLCTLNADETDLLILPSLKNAEKEVIDFIKRLYNQGVSLFAVSDISGLEELFGVTPNPSCSKIYQLNSESEIEGVLPIEAELKYKANGAETLIYADNTLPVLMKHNRTAILNAPVSSLGIDSFTDRVQYGRESISRLLKRNCNKVLKELSTPLIEAENCGLSSFIDENEDTIVVLFDYSPYNQNELFTKTTNVVVKLNIPNVIDVKSGHEVNRFYQNGSIRKIEVTLKPHETAVIKLCF